MKKAAYTIALIFLLLLPLSAFGIEPDESGLITGGEFTVPIVVLSLKQAGANVGLTEAKVLREVELRLLRNGIIPADREAAYALGWYFGVDLLIAESEITGRTGCCQTGNVARLLSRGTKPPTSQKGA